MRKLVIIFCFLLAGCSGYSEKDLGKARDEGYKQGYEEGYAMDEEEAQESMKTAYNDGHEYGFTEGFSLAQEEAKVSIETAYNDGHEDGFTEGYVLAEEEAQKVQETAYTEGYVAGVAASRSYSNNSDGNLGDISYSIKGSLNTLGTPSIDIDGYDWRFMLDYDKRDLIEAIAENQGKYLSRDEVDNIIYLIDGYYENGMKYKTVGEVLEEL
ncbi:hypothetical protein [Saccharococcus sp. Marseille-Q5394]|uniref:hypothetical protein n=1 Tax=Saccharococcus sp. Marseille-Q5394 TaxID=2972778 RepID=UPI0021C8701A|nr:hypothetical protein [Saccharococcus sp. Marseille-Q5394]